MGTRLRIFPDFAVAGKSCFLTAEVFRGIMGKFLFAHGRIAHGIVKSAPAKVFRLTKNFKHVLIRMPVSGQNLFPAAS